jgi:hypothetical protein
LVWWFPVWQLLDRWLLDWCHLGFAVTVDCFGFSVGWFIGVGPVSFRLSQILPQQASCSGFGEAGLKALGLAVSVWQLLDSGGVRYTVRTLEPTSAKPDAGKAAG